MLKPTQQALKHCSVTLVIKELNQEQLTKIKINLVVISKAVLQLYITLSVRLKELQMNSKKDR